jgi:hypothetical protein
MQNVAATHGNLRIDLTVAILRSIKNVVAIDLSWIATLLPLATLSFVVERSFVKRLNNFVADWLYFALGVLFLSGGDRLADQQDQYKQARLNWTDKTHRVDFLFLARVVAGEFT